MSTESTLKNLFKVEMIKKTLIKKQDYKEIRKQNCKEGPLIYHFFHQIRGPH